jgi:thiosulfate dehydrogenase
MNQNKSKIKINIKYIAVTCLFIAVVLGGNSCNTSADEKTNTPTRETSDSTHTTLLPDTASEMVKYGRELIVNTSRFLGPDGSVGQYLGNKMNCSNCHLDAGSRPHAFSFYHTFERYPQFRARENEVLTLAQRINNCVERPHNGISLPLESKEILAMVSYIKWLSTQKPPSEQDSVEKPVTLAYPDRPADPLKGAAIFAQHCSSCHGANGAGTWNADSTTYVYPPLWGPDSYQAGSSPHRVVMLARFIKANMPDKLATFDKPFLTDEQALDVAAFINDDRIHPRPTKKHGSTPDYLQSKLKPIDYPVGPFTDPFSADQHKFGPYKPIIEYHLAHNLKSGM